MQIGAIMGKEDRCTMVLESYARQTKRNRGIDMIFKTKCKSEPEQYMLRQR